MDAILGLVIMEALLLGLYNRWTGHGLRPGRFLPNLAAGFFLLLTARLALGEATAWTLALCLLLSLGAHLTDLATRWNAIGGT